MNLFKYVLNKKGVYDIFPNERTFANNPMILRIPGMHKGRHVSIACGSFSGMKCKELRIGEGVETIGANAFFSCEELQKVTLPKSLKEIGKGAFSLTPHMVSIAVDKENERYYSVNDCLIDRTNHELIVGCSYSIIPYDLDITSIGPQAFYCVSFTTALENLPNTIVEIKEEAFYGSSNIKQLKLPLNIQRIGKSVFERSDIENAIIPLSVIEMGESVFCESRVKKMEWRTKLPVIPKDSFSSTPIKKVFIPKWVRKIGDWCFCESSLEKIEFDEGCEEIGNHAFLDASNLIKIKLPRTIKVIHDYAFSEFARMNMEKIEYSGTIQEWSERVVVEEEAILPWVVIKCVDGLIC